MAAEWSVDAAFIFSSSRARLNIPMRIGALAAFALILLAAAPAEAGRGGAQPLDRILSHLRAERGGTFYDAEGPFDDGNGNIHYRIKWLTPQGRLIWLDTDARTGRVLGVDGNDGQRGNHFDNDQGDGDDYDHQPRETFPRDPRWPRWDNGAPVGGGQWHDRGRGGGRWRDKDDDHHGHGDPD